MLWLNKANSTAYLNFFSRLWKGRGTYDFPNLQITLSYYIYFWLTGKILYALQIVAIMELQTLNVCIFSLKGLPKRKTFVLHWVGKKGIVLSEPKYYLKCHTGGFSLTISNHSLSLEDLTGRKMILMPLQRIKCWTWSNTRDRAIISKSMQV